MAGWGRRFAARWRSCEDRRVGGERLWLAAGHVADGVGERVAAQIAVAPEHLAAGVALVWLVVGVGEEVGFQVAALVEGAVAYVALVRRVVGMHLLVHGQGARLAEPFAAIQALEWLVLGVDESVTIKASACFNR